MSACKRIRGDISLFQRLWDQKTFPEFVAWPNALWTDSPDESTPLWTDDEGQSELLLNLEFTEFKWALTLRAVLLDNYDIVRVFLEHSGLISNGKSSLSRPGSPTSHGHVWEMLEIPIFHKIVVSFVTTDIVPYRTNSLLKKLRGSEFETVLKYNINRVLV